MPLTKADAIYAICGAVSVAIIALTSNGGLQRWLDEDSAWVLFFVAILLGHFALQHGFLLALVTLHKRRVQPFAWLLTRSRHAIAAILPLTAGVIFAGGVALGVAFSSDIVLGATVITSLTIIFATQWTFRGGMGPLAAYLRERLDAELERYR